MRTLNKLKNQSGFTIIEVLIVLAIAGLIMLVVFLAVPALQRNSRNTQRNHDASLVLTSVNECLNNKNGQTTSCDTSGEIQPAFLDLTKLRQLQTVNFGNGMPADATSVNIAFSSSCNPAGDARVATTNARQFVALFNIENTAGANVPRCVES